MAIRAPDGAKNLRNTTDLDLLRSGHPPSLGGLVHPVDVVVHVQHELHLGQHEVYFL